MSELIQIFLATYITTVLAIGYIRFFSKDCTCHGQSDIALNRVLLILLSPILVPISLVLAVVISVMVFISYTINKGLRRLNNVS